MKVFAWINKYSPIVINVGSIQYDSVSRSIFISDTAGDRYIIRSIDSATGNRLIDECFSTDKVRIGQEFLIEKIV